MKSKHHNPPPAPATRATPPPPPGTAKTQPGGTATATDKPAGDGPKATLPPDQVPSPQQRPTLDMIRERAYHKWVEAGQPAGDGKDFWAQAEAEVNGMSGEWSETGGRAASR